MPEAYDLTLDITRLPNHDILQYLFEHMPAQTQVY